MRGQPRIPSAGENILYMKIDQNKTETEIKFSEDIETIPGTKENVRGTIIISLEIKKILNKNRRAIKSKHSENNKSS